jgi:hypothetical protein
MSKKLVFYTFERKVFKDNKHKTEWALQAWIEPPMMYDNGKWVLHTWDKEPTYKQTEEVKKIIKRAMDFQYRYTKIEENFTEVIDWGESK